MSSAALPPWGSRPDRQSKHAARRARRDRRARRACEPGGSGESCEALERRQLLTVAAASPIVRPDHVVVVIEEDRACAALGDRVDMPYLNQLADTGLAYTNAHGLGHPSEPNYLGLYSGSTQGITDNFSGYTFSGPNLAQALNSAPAPAGGYFSFSGFVEALPHDGDTTTRMAGDPNDPTAPPDLYVRNYNPMAQFTDAGQQGGVPLTNAQVNKTFASFPTTNAGYAALPTVSYVIPDNLHNTHGSNEQAPWATDPSVYDSLRSGADSWLKNKLDGYLQWAKTHNSLLIVTTDEEETDSHPSGTLTTVLNGDPGLFVAGQNSRSVNPFNLLRTIEDMYGLSPLNDSANVAALDTDSAGRLAPTVATPAPAATTTGLTSSANPAAWGQALTLTATVSAAGGSALPTGTVTFKDGASVLGTAPLNASGQAFLTLSALAVGGHSLAATYAGNASFAASASPALAQTVSAAATATTLNSSANPSVAGQGVTFTAAVAAGSPGAGTPTGSVTFSDGGTTLGSAPLDAIGHAALTTAALSSGPHAITASYAGDAHFAASGSAALSQTVNATGSTAATVALTSSANPSVVGQSVSFTATVAASGTATGNPTGTVQFVIDGANAGAPVALVGGSATSPAVTTLGPGPHSIGAVYGGDAAFAAATAPALTQGVGAAATATALSASPNPSASGQGVTFTATVSVTAPGSGTPAGTVTFLDAGLSLGTASLSASGTATFSTASLSAGAHSITASYAGSAPFAASTSAAVAQQVSPAAPQAPATVDASDGTYSDRVRVTWAASAGASAYEVWRGTRSNSGSATRIATVDATLGTLYDDTAALSGRTYWYWVKAKNAAGTSRFSVSNAGYRASGPTNNAFASATVLGGTSLTATGTNTNATKEANEPNHAGNAGGRSVWWAWTAPANGTVTIDTRGSNFNTLLAVYTGGGLGSLSAVPGGSNDNDPAGGTTSRVSFAVTAGTVYWIAVDGSNGASGSIALNLSLT